MITVRAYAKINLCLEITGQREDGYHLLDMVMQNVSLYDRLTFEPAEELTLLADDGVPAGADNLVMKAALRLQALTGCSKGCRIRLEKHIPSQAGMGGASADAAATLWALDRLWQTGISKEQMASLAVKLGADVPFFLAGGTARAQGIGEVLTSVHGIAPMEFAAIKPAEGLSTPVVYKAWDSEPSAAVGASRRLLEALQADDRSAAAAAMVNTLEAPAIRLCTAVENALDAVRETSPLAAMMTGSGTVVFGWYPDAAAADRAAACLEGPGRRVLRFTGVPYALQEEKTAE